MSNDNNTQRETAIIMERIYTRFADEIEMERAKSAYEPKEEYQVDGEYMLLTFEEAVELRKKGKTVTVYY